MTEQISNAITGYINTDYLASAIPETLTITNLPSCGVLTKQGTATSDQTFALFWSYTSEEDYTIEMGVGDQVNLSDESLIFTGDDDCEVLQDNFEYMVDANMPVNGATTTGYVRQAEGAGAEKLTATTIGLSAYMSAKLSNMF